MAENAGFLSLSLLKKERETVVIKFSLKLQKIAENNNSLHGCWILCMHEIVPMLLLQKYKKLLPGTLWITYLLFRRKQLKSEVVIEPIRCHPTTPLLKVQEVKSPGSSLHFALIYQSWRWNPQTSFGFPSPNLTINRKGWKLSCLVSLDPAEQSHSGDSVYNMTLGKKRTRDLSMGVGGEKSHISKMTVSNPLLSRDKGDLLACTSFCRDTLEGWLVRKIFH